MVDPTLLCFLKEKKNQLPATFAGMKKITLAKCITFIDLKITYNNIELDICNLVICVLGTRT